MISYFMLWMVVSCDGLGFWGFHYVLDCLHFWYSWLYFETFKNPPTMNFCYGKYILGVASLNFVWFVVK